MEERAAGVRSCRKGKMLSISVPKSKVCSEYKTWEASAWICWFTPRIEECMSPGLLSRQYVDSALRERIRSAMYLNLLRRRIFRLRRSYIDSSSVRMHRVMSM